MRYILLIFCIPISAFGMLEHQSERKPALYRMEPFHEKRYMLEERKNGDVYICEQELFPRNFISIPSIYGRRAVPITAPNPDFVPYEAQGWFNEQDIVIVRHQDGTLSGFLDVRSTTDRPSDRVDIIGATKDVYIIKEKP